MRSDKSQIATTSGPSFWQGDVWVTVDAGHGQCHLKGGLGKHNQAGLLETLGLKACIDSLWGGVVSGFIFIVQTRGRFGALLRLSCGPNKGPWFFVGLHRYLEDMPVLLAGETKPNPQVWSPSRYEVVREFICPCII